MKERYEALKMEVIAFLYQDIITTSSDETAPSGDSDDNEWD